MTNGAALLELSGIGLSMQARALLLAFALFGAGCRSVSAPAAAPAAPPLPPLPQFVLQPAWSVHPRSDKEANDFLRLWNLGDLDSDGFEEFAAGEESFPNNWAWLVSGRDGTATLEALNVAVAPHGREDAARSFDMAREFVNVGDADGDGLPDIAMSECTFDPFGRSVPSGMWLLSAAPWRVLRTWRRDVDSFGLFVAPIGDVDGDGKADTATVEDCTPPAVEVLSLTRKDSLWRIRLPIKRGSVHDFVAIGDVDADGLSELAVRAAVWQDGYRSSLFVLSGKRGAVMWSRSASVIEGRCIGRIESAGDVEGDGAADIWHVSSDPATGQSCFEILSGRDGSSLRSSATKRTRHFREGTCSDLDGDGANDLIVLWWPDESAGEPLLEVVSSRSLGALFRLPCEGAECFVALRTPNGVRLVLGSEASLQAFDLVRVEAGR